ncbi:MAG TPA: CoA pyrophosphatase [Firmicutes bacterium]|nr:CoA pyrophosphatase [Bacillota bacterium]
MIILVGELTRKDLAALFSGRRRELLDAELYTRSAVFLPLIKDAGGAWQVLFEVRAAGLARQPGEICFPGGRVEEADAGEQETACRETAEELGLTRQAITVWGELDYIVTPFNLFLYPFVGEIDTSGGLMPNPAEVAEVFTLPLTLLATLRPEIYLVPVQAAPPADFPFAKIPHGRAYPWRTGLLPEVFYEVNGRIIWGLTARILKDFLEIVITP